jgi:galactose mutarotase-like enzyme
MPNDKKQWLALKSDDLQVEIDPLGAQLSTLRDAAGRDFLWSGDPAVWNGRAPLLFPIVGALVDGRYRLGSKTYSLARHGFARLKPFDPIETSASEATFRLKADASTLSIYPFHFELDVHFAVRGPTLSVSAFVRNGGDDSMPASVGYHPAFRWPLPGGGERGAHFIEFAENEVCPLRRLDANGLLTQTLFPTPLVGRRLALEDKLFREDVMIFDRLRSRSLTYGTQNGPKIKLEFPDSPILGIWSKPGAGFLCIEPWHGIADPVGFAGDFKDKLGVFTLPPGGELVAKMLITLVPAADAH